MNRKRSCAAERRTVSHPTEDGADTLLDGIVRAVRQRLVVAATSEAPIALAGGETAAIQLQGTRWSISASNSGGVIRGASVALAVAGSE